MKSDQESILEKHINDIRRIVNAAIDEKVSPRLDALESEIKATKAVSESAHEEIKATKAASKSAHEEIKATKAASKSAHEEIIERLERLENRLK